jgi:hypothetical protein
MLRIGTNEYELVRVQSGFAVTLHSPDVDVLKRNQVWELVAHYAPHENRYTLRADGEPEFLRVVLQSEEYAVKDWRKLSGLGLDQEGDHWFGHAWIENLLVGHYDKEQWSLVPGWLDVELKHDYLFHCEFDGSRKLADGTEEDMEFKDDLPFKEVTAYAPINTADPVAAARAMAARTVGLTEFAESRVQPYDPQRKSHLSIRVNTHHIVTLQTPWRQHLA